MINFNLTTSVNYSGVQQQLKQLIQKHLPEGSFTETYQEYVEGALNFSLFIRQEADVLMSHGAADKNYHWKVEEGKRVNEHTRRRYLFVPGNFLVKRIAKSKRLTFGEDSVFSVGWPRLDMLLEAQRVYDTTKTKSSKIKVLWAPTHSYNKKGDDEIALSSYPDFEPFVEKLADTFDVSVSLHPRNRSDKTPTHQLLLEADVVISDLGTLVWEAWALGKTLVFPSWVIKDRMSTYVKNSAEWHIFNEGYGLHPTDYEHLLSLIHERPTMDERTRAFFENFLDPTYLGSSGERIAKLLLRLAQKKRLHVQMSQDAITRRGMGGRKMTLSRHRKDLQVLAENYRVADNLVLDEGKLPLIYWKNADNFGDLLSPWLFTKMTGLPVAFSEGKTPCYTAIGSILKRVTDASIVWGTGSFGTESNRQVAKQAQYLAVRGPLTRTKIINAGLDCPAVYGDPALLTPLYYWPEIEQEWEMGVVLRWSEKQWVKRKFGKGIKKIFLKTDDVEGVIRDMLSCKRIITSSLHGLIIADAYGIPSAWLASETPKGGEFKFYDYFLTVDKVRHAQSYDLAKAPVELTDFLKDFSFDDKPISFDYEALLEACPLLEAR